MSEEARIVWLKRVLIFKIVVTVILWGLPQWLGPVAVLQRYGRVPDPPLYMRIAGGNSIALAFLFLLALRDPVRNRDIIRYAVVDNAISFATLIAYAMTVGLVNPMSWVSAGLLLFFTIAFFALIPAKTTQPAFGAAR